VRGTLLNTATVIAGSLVGIFLHTRLPQRLTEIAFQAIGLFTLLLGFTMAAQTRHILILILAIVSGALIGELIDIDKYLNRFGDWLKKRLRRASERLCLPGTLRFSEGLVAAFLLFCMGSMTVLGAIEEGMGKPPNLFLAKSLLDGFAAIALAAGLGVGVLFSAVPLLLYQGGLTLLASSLHKVLSDPVVNEMSAVGGLVLIGLGINILEIKKLKVSNMLPGLVIAGLLAHLFVRR